MPSIPQKIIKCLDKNRVKYEILKHRTVYTAFDKAATLRIKPNLIGKTLVVKTDSGLAIVLVPANRNLDKNKLKKAVQVKKVDFASERLIKNKIKGVKVGTVPPLGELWKLPTFADRALFSNPRIVINSGDYNFSVKISPAGFRKLMPNLIIGGFSQSR